MKFPKITLPFVASAETMFAAAAIPVLTALAVPEEMTALVNLAHPGTPEAVQILIRAALLGVASRVLYMTQPKAPTAAPSPVAAPVSTPVVAQATYSTVGPATRPLSPVKPVAPRLPVDLDSVASTNVYERVMSSATNVNSV